MWYTVFSFGLARAERVQNKEEKKRKKKTTTISAPAHTISNKNPQERTGKTPKKSMAEERGANHGLAYTIYIYYTYSSKKIKRKNTTTKKQKIRAHI